MQNRYIKACPQGYLEQEDAIGCKTILASDSEIDNKALAWRRVYEPAIKYVIERVMEQK